MVDMKGSWRPCMPMPKQREFWVGIILGAALLWLILRFVI